MQFFLAINSSAATFKKNEENNAKHSGPQQTLRSHRTNTHTHTLIHAVIQHMCYVFYFTIQNTHTLTSADEERNVSAIRLERSSESVFEQLLTFLL